MNPVGNPAKRRLRAWASSAMLAATCAISCAATPAHAEGTAAGSIITNVASASFDVAGIGQNPVSYEVKVKVDRKINIVVAKVSTAPTPAAPGQANAAIAFTVTNTSNATLDFALGMQQQANGAQSIYTNLNDAFDLSNLKYFLDDGDGVFVPGTDPEASFIDELQADNTRTVFLVGKAPQGRQFGDIAGIALLAIAREGGTANGQGAALVETTGGNTDEVDTVFADQDGPFDLVRDATASALDAFTIYSPQLTLTKTYRLISDPFNGTTAPTLIPGSIVEFCVIATNGTGNATANDVVLSDPLPQQFAFLSAYGIRINGTFANSQCNEDGAPGGTFTGTAISGTFSSIAGGETRTMRYRATVN